MCVRLCDGYFFPISFAVPREYLARDARRCQESCGAEARLFFHSNVNADIADMTDLEGRPYSNLEAAFLYRAAYFPTCKCQPHPWERRPQSATACMRWQPPLGMATRRQRWNSMPYRVR